MNTTEQTPPRQHSVGEDELLHSARAMMSAYERIIDVCDRLDGLVDDCRQPRPDKTKQNIFNSIDSKHKFNKHENNQND